MKTLVIAISVGALMGCSTDHFDSSLEATKVVVGKAATPPATGCTLDLAQDEVDFLLLNPNEVAGHIGVGIKNNLTNVNLNAVLGVDQFRFNPKTAYIQYEVIGGSASIPDSQSIAMGSVAAAQEQPVTLFVNGGRELASLAAGTFVRTRIYFKGNLNDGSSVTTGSRLAVFEICTTAGCSTPCL